MSRLVAAPRRIEFVCLRTDSSPQIALHLASQRRSYLRLRSLWLPPTWTLTMLMWRLHGRTHSRMLLAGIQAKSELDPRLKHSGVTPLSVVFVEARAIFSVGDTKHTKFFLRLCSAHHANIHSVCF